MIRVFNSSYATSDEKFIPLNEVNIVAQKICMWTDCPYIIFEHKDFPLGSLRADYKNNNWECDLN